MDEISQLISNVGFPIVAWIFMYKQQVKLQETITELSSTLKGIDTRISGLKEKTIKKEVYEC